MADDSSAPAEAENIAVCIRVRPMNERETRAGDAAALSCVPQLNAVSLLDPATRAPLSGKGNVFQYDGLFDELSDSHAIYERVARRIVRSTLGGINGSIFAYGQTSSGKTHTMQGDGGMPFQPEHEALRPGILQLAVEDIFSYIESCADRDFLLRVSFLEIYNEVVRDLLNPSEKGASLKLREDPRKGVYVESKEEIITNYQDIVTLLQTGNQNRTTGQTAMNDKSSRSHSVFRIVVESKEKTESRRHSEEDVNGAVLVASLNLVDLAGSESLRHTGAEGIRQREAGNINKSLLTLARVINSLASSGGGGQNAPFRDSKLTRLLQNSLGGNTRTLIICCVTPSDRYIEETKSTLQFAARAKDIKTSATVNEVLDDQTQLRRLKREVRELKKLVNSEALTALKAENEALLSEKTHNKTEMARLTGLILSSSSVTKAAVRSKGKQHGKRMRETWGPGDFPASITGRGPDVYPRKRRSPAKENVDPQTLFRVYEDANEDVEKEAENPVFDPAASKFKPLQTDLGVEDSSKNVLDLFSAVFRSYRDRDAEDPIAALETIANEKSVSLGDIERARAFDVLAEIRTLMVANEQTRTALDDKLVLEQELKELRAKLSYESTEDTSVSCNCSGNASEAGALVEEIMAELVSTQEKLASEEKRCQDLEAEKMNAQLMAAEELDCLRVQLETLQVESTEARKQFDSEKHQLEAALETFQSGFPQSDDGEKMSLRSRKNELEGLLEEMKASQTVLQMVVAERDEEIASLKSHASETNQEQLELRVKCLEEDKALLHQTISELEAHERNSAPTTEVSSASGDKEAPQESSTDQATNGVVEKLAGELQEIMNELSQLQSDLETTTMEKENLQAQTERISEELEESQRQGYEMSEAFMEKEHIAKVLQAQLDAKLMTISQLRSKHSGEIEALQQTIQGLTAEKEQLLANIQEPFDGDSEKTESTAENHNVEMDAGEHQDAESQVVRSEVEQLTEKLSVVEAELVETKERLQAALILSENTPEESEFKAAFEKLQMDFENLQQESKIASDALLVQEQPAGVLPSDEQSTGSLQQRYDTLSEDYRRISGDLERVSCERSDCLEELQALESQLMEVSEEKMKLAVAVDEQGFKLREVEHAVSASTETIATLQAQLEEAESSKAALKTSKTELEQHLEKIQAALEALQAVHAVEVRQNQHCDASIQTGSETSDGETEQLQQRLEIEAKQREKLQLDVRSYEETLSLLRKESKDSSDTIADLLEQMKLLKTDLASASRTQEQKDKELSSLSNALARSEEEMQEMRLQSQQRLVAAEGKEIVLEEKVSALEQQLRMTSTGVNIASVLAESDAQTELTESREKQIELQAKITSLENQLAEAGQELRNQDEDWSKKQTMAEREFARLMTEQKQLRDQVSALQNDAGASQHEMKAQAEELLNAKQSCAELLEQKESVQRELDAAKATWEDKQQELTGQMESIREQFQEAQEELEAYQKNADDEIHRLRSVIEQTEVEIENLKQSAKAREEELESQIGEQENWQNQVKTRQEALQEKCDELDDERRLLKEEYAALEAQCGDAEEQLRNKILGLSQKYAAAQVQQADSHAKLEQMKAQLEMSENEMNQYHSKLESLTDSLKSSQSEAVQYHNQLVEAQLAKENMDKLVEKQKARIDKLDKVKMTTDILDMFRKLKNDRLDLQNKVKELQTDLAQAEQTLKQSQEDHHEKETRLGDLKDEKLNVFKEQVEELREALRVEKHQLADIKAEMRAALNDEREKADHEIQEMQVLLKEKLDLVGQLEAQVGSVKDEMAKLREQKGDKVSYLEKENLDLHVENRELKKRLESSSSLHEKEELLGDTGTYDASAAEAAKVLDEVATPRGSGSDTSQPQGSTKVGGFLLSTSELGVITADSQEEPNGGERPECPQQ
ncbi:Centromere-associated protein E [Phytophthora ramorum]|uniref:Centromere-associated protein E n=1 Tax=Phytophthora ramorum TaxID=164328 RepID=UPI0030A32E85|nr:Centromere-associated protein E [Phytophthora ramorum]